MIQMHAFQFGLTENYISDGLNCWMAVWTRNQHIFQTNKVTVSENNIGAPKIQIILVHPTCEITYGAVKLLIFKLVNLSLLIP